MAKVDGSLGSLIQGVSQQPARARLPGQSEEQLNIVNDTVFGMSRRPAFVHDTAYSKYGTDDMEHGSLRAGKRILKYALRRSETDAAMKVIDGGTTYEVSVNANVEDYLKSTPSTENAFVLREMDERIYLLNKQKTVASLDSIPAEMIQNQTVCYLRGGKYASAFTIDFELPGGTHQIIVATNDGSLAAHTSKTTVKAIASDLYTLCTSAPTGSSGATPQDPAVPGTDPAWVATDGLYYATTGAQAAITASFNITTMGEYLIFDPIPAALDYKITCTETSGSDLFEDVRDTIKSVGKLPNRAAHGMVVKVEGSNREEDDYYLRWTLDDAVVGDTPNRKGRWIECSAPGERHRLDPTSLPHELYWTGTVWSIRQIDWAKREAGNNKSNPMPKLIGQPINDIFDFQGRSAFLHGPYLTTSQSKEYSNLFKETATAELETDPINIRSSSTDGESELVIGVQFNRDIIIFANNGAQFMLSGRTTQTSKTASMVLTSEFEVDLSVRPVVVGSNIMFLSSTGQYSALHEMYLLGNQESHERRTVTDHVPRYMVGQPKLFTADDAMNMAMVVCDDLRTIYLYQFLWIDDRRVQSSWSQWSTDADVLDIAIRDGNLHVVTASANGAFLVSEARLNRPDTQSLPHHIHLDNRHTVDLLDETTIDVVVSRDDAEIVVVQGTGVGAGVALQLESVVPLTVASGPNMVRVTLREGYTGQVVVGQRYVSRIVPTMPIIRDRDGVAVTSARLTVSDFIITYRDTGPFTVSRECAYEAPEDYWTDTYSGRTLGDPDFQLGTVPMDSGHFDFPFEDGVETSQLSVECSTHLPMTITEIEWNGHVNNRSRRITNGG